MPLWTLPLVVRIFFFFLIIFPLFLFSVLFLLKKLQHDLDVLALSYLSLMPECDPSQSHSLLKAVSFCARWPSFPTEGA